MSGPEGTKFDLSRHSSSFHPRPAMKYVSVFLTGAPALPEPGRITLALHEGASPSATKTVSIDYDERRFDVTSEPIAIEDKLLRAGWGDQLTRIILTSKQTQLSDAFTITIRP